MSVALKLIVVVLTVANFSAASPVVSGSAQVQNVERTLFYRSSQHQARRNDYTYTPGIGAHKVHTQAASWNTARRTCNEEGGHLAVINSVAESEVIGQLLTNSRPHNGSLNSNLAHIGIRNLYEDDDWVTIHGESVADMGFDIWQQGEPDNRGNVEHCGSVYLNGKSADIRCTGSLGFICEIPDAMASAPNDRQVPIEASRQFLPATVRKDYTYTPGIGAHKVHTQAVSWNTARRTCNEEGGHLAVINSVAESEVIGQLLTNSRPHNGSLNSNLAHIGIRNLYEDDDWVTIHGESVADMGFDIWQPGEPDNRGNVEHCGSVYLNGKSADIRCTGSLGFICEIPVTVTPAPNDRQVPIDVEFQPMTERKNYTYFPNVGAYKFHTEEVTWNTARETCEDEGGHLAVINSVAESQLLGQLLSNASAHLNWIWHAHIGFHELHNDTDWVTIHGDSLAIAGFDIWEENEPSHSFNNTEHCGSLGRSGTLNDLTCTKLRSFICELPYALSAAPSIKEGKARTLTRRDDYSYTPNIGAHKVHTDEKKWNDARRICEEEGGHLAVINSYTESQIITRLVGQTNSPSTQYNVHIGFHNLYKEGQFVTIDGVPLEKVGFNQWAFGNPSGGEDCGALTSEGQLNDVGCDSAIGFVCELPYVKPDPLQHEPETTTHAIDVWEIYFDY